MNNKSSGQISNARFFTITVINLAAQEIVECHHGFTVFACVCGIIKAPGTLSVLNRVPHMLTVFNDRYPDKVRLDAIPVYKPVDGLNGTASNMARNAQENAIQTPVLFAIREYASDASRSLSKSPRISRLYS